MKKLLAIVVLGLLWSNIAIADNIVGKKLLCQKEKSFFANLFPTGEDKEDIYIGFEFYSIVSAVEYSIENWEVKEKRISIDLDPKYITIIDDNLRQINRETLIFYNSFKKNKSKLFKCQSAENYALREFFSSVLREKKDVQKRKNKL